MKILHDKRDLLLAGYATTYRLCGVKLLGGMAFLKHLIHLQYG
jgi:hypothetical protein